MAVEMDGMIESAVLVSLDPPELIKAITQCCFRLESRRWPIYLSYQVAVIRLAISIPNLTHQ